MLRPNPQSYHWTVPEVKEKYREHTAAGSIIYHYALHTLRQTSCMSSVDYISSFCVSCHPALTDKWDAWSHGTYTGNYKVVIGHGWHQREVMCFTTGLCPCLTAQRVKNKTILTKHCCLRPTPSSVCHTLGHYLIAWELVAPPDRSHWFQATKSVTAR